MVVVYLKRSLETLTRVYSRFDARCGIVPRGAHGWWRKGPNLAANREPALIGLSLRIGLQKTRYVRAVHSDAQNLRGSACKRKRYAVHYPQCIYLDSRYDVCRRARYASDLSCNS